MTDSNNLHTLINAEAGSDVTEFMHLARHISNIPPGNAAPDGKEIAACIDHTNLNAAATPEDIHRCCEEAMQHRFAAVCINPAYVPLAAKLLAGSAVALCTVAGFPLGASSTKTKVFETMDAMEAGADEIDIVLNISRLKAGDYGYVFEELSSVVEALGAWNKSSIIKVIAENCYLSDREKAIACIIAREAGAHFIKTSTGFGPSGAVLEDVVLMKHIVKDRMKIKAAGGIRTKEDAVLFLSHGADRIGSSSGVAILSQ